MTPYPNIYSVILSPTMVIVLVGRDMVSENCTHGIPVVNPKYSRNWGYEPLSDPSAV